MIKIWNENLFLTTKFALSERSRPLKHQKYDGQQYYVDKPVRKSKNILTISMFFLSPGTLLTSPIDRSRSQLFRTFFLASWRFRWRPKRPHFNFPIFTIFPIFGIFHDFRSISFFPINFLIFFHEILPEHPL